MLPCQSPTGEPALQPHPGGSVFNTAISLGRLGVSTGLFTGLSNDMFGKQLQAALDESRVDISLASISNRPTTLAFVELINGQASYAFYDENTAGRMIGPNDLPELPAQIKALFLGGISLACDPCADTYLKLAQLNSANRTLMLDPNIRPDFIKDENRYRARMHQLIGMSDILKVSDEDLTWLIRSPKPVIDKAAELLDQGPSIVILTCGADGAIGFLKDGRKIQIPAIPVDAVDTVGAGDAFNAGFLANLYEQKLLGKG